MPVALDAMVPVAQPAISIGGWRNLERRRLPPHPRTSGPRQTPTTGAPRTPAPTAATPAASIAQGAQFGQGEEGPRPEGRLEGGGEAAPDPLHDHDHAERSSSAPHGHQATGPGGDRPREGDGSGGLRAAGPDPTPGSARRLDPPPPPSRPRRVLKLRLTPRRQATQPPPHPIRTVKSDTGWLLLNAGGACPGNGRITSCACPAPRSIPRGRSSRFG
jgi:hypothetical protein